MSDFSTHYRQYKFQSEYESVDHLIRELDWNTQRAERVSSQAMKLVKMVRSTPLSFGSLESFTQTYGLNTDEGIALMCLAESLLRIPDAHTANALIEDKVMLAEWINKNDQNRDWLANFASYGLVATKKTLNSVLSKIGEPLIRQGMRHAMKMIGEQFVLGETIGEALNTARNGNDSIAAGSLCSFDMLGEGAMTHEDAERYYEAYWQAVEFIGQDKEKHSVSVKLSALYPRYVYAQKEKCVSALVSKMRELCRLASTFNMDLTIDAEETDRLDLSLEIFSQLSQDPALVGWNGLGFVLQAYHKQAYSVIDTLCEIAKRDHRHIRVRLVKGAYWDSEIKWAQERGLKDYPVYTRKYYTDLSYLACAQKLLSYREHLYPMFATHNAHTVAAVLDLERTDVDGLGGYFEFQCLYGMGRRLYQAVRDVTNAKIRVYAPVGTHTVLLPYLVRRLLENGANSSFVGKLHNPDIDLRKIVEDPYENSIVSEGRSHPRIPLPQDIYGTCRRNSEGIDFSSSNEMDSLLEQIDKAVHDKSFQGVSYIAGEAVRSGHSRKVLNPADQSEVIGEVWYAEENDIHTAVSKARFGYDRWRLVPATERAEILRSFADLLEENQDLLIGLCVREAGKTLHDAHMEVREAVDFARYYAMMGLKDFGSQGLKLPGVMGEENRLYMEGRGVFVCISPWNFPLAIFCGQVLAALMAGNSVVAKPAEQTPIMASKVTELLYSAGIPDDVFSLLQGDGDIGANLVSHEGIDGVAFTGSCEVAKAIQKTLASKKGGIVPLIAETGGQNAMIVDSSALPEQVVRDVISSGFGSAGQRCSALRILCLQKDIAEKVIDMLKGAMEAIVVGDPRSISSDVGPVIDDQALSVLHSHQMFIDGFGDIVSRVSMDSDLEEKGYFFAPLLVRIKTLECLEREVFGPVIHVYIYESPERDDLIRRINKLGYGLTFGIHSRVGKSINHISRQISCGNIYVNRGMTGAVVGAQPFGGNGLSGTGPKAGGPNYLHAFAIEKVVSDDITARGGNLDLVNLSEQNKRKGAENQPLYCFFILQLFMRLQDDHC